MGALHGVPITVKENVDYEGRPNPNGVPANMNIIAPSDSPVVRNLRNAGAIVIGLTNTPEFSFRARRDTEHYDAVTRELQGLEQPSKNVS